MCIFRQRSHRICCPPRSLCDMLPHPAAVLTCSFSYARNLPLRFAVLSATQIVGYVPSQNAVPTPLLGLQPIEGI